MLCVRIVFCLFAEDAGLFEKDAFYRYLSSFDAQQLRSALLELFKVLDTPVPDRDPYLSDRLRAFPYVNGGLFKGNVEIPNFTESIRSLLLNEVAQDTDWSQISPTIFGGVFESTLNLKLVVSAVCTIPVRKTSTRSLILCSLTIFAASSTRF